MSKKIAYIGFSKINGQSHLAATNAGIAQSDFTCEILKEAFECDYYIAQSDVVIDSNEIKNHQFRMRIGLINNLIDSFKLVMLINKKGPYAAIVVYHSLLFFLVTFFLALLKYKQVLQVNEIFYRSKSKISISKKIIEKFMFKLADNFIVSTNSLCKFLFDPSNVIAVIPGPIHVVENIEKKLSHRKKINDDSISEKTKLVYAGIIDREKNGGAFIAVDLASKLNSMNFMIDIYGFGSEEDLASLHKYIAMNNERSHTQVKYCGVLQPIELVSHLSSYDIGLSTQYLGTQFSESSFPSKILTYLSAGLNIACASSTAVDSWEYSYLLFIYRDGELNDLVNFIRSGNLKNRLSMSKQISLIRSQILSNISRGI